MEKTDWRGWLIHATNWHGPLLVGGEWPKGHIAWVHDESQAKGFRKKREAQEFMDNVPNHGGLTYELRFHPWRAQRTGAEP